MVNQNLRVPVFECTGYIWMQRVEGNVVASSNSVPAEVG